MALKQPSMLEVLFLLLLSSSLVRADIAGPGPEVIAIGLVALAVLGAIVVGAAYGAWLLLKWIKKKYAKK